MGKNKKAMKFTVSESFQHENFLPVRQPRTVHAETLVPEDVRLAMDSCLPNSVRTMLEYDREGSNFLGYPFLQSLSQNPLISAGVETVADEMTKKFVKLVYKSNDEELPESEAVNIHVKGKLKKLESSFDNFNIATVFRKSAENIGYYGGCLVYIDTGVRDSEILKSPLILDPATFRQGSLKGFAVIDPINVTPGLYNTTDPTKNDYFKPQTWYVLGKEIHASRFLYFAGKEAPLLYKPSYNFFGVSTAQLAFEYAENFQKNRDSASELLNKFSVSVFKTNMMGALGGKGTAEIDNRIRYFIKNKNNDGVLVLDKEEEDFVKVETPLSGVTDIVRQSLELIAAVFRIPAVKYLGISPSGFNATGESDLKNFYSLIESLQKKQFADNLETVLKVLQLNIYGEIDEYIGFEFIPMNEEDSKIKADTKKVIADTEKVKADTLAVYADRNLISPEESRKILAEDKEGLFKSIDADDTEFMDKLGAFPEQGEIALPEGEPNG